MNRGKNKTCKGKVLSLGEEEECGVWLDAAELRAKKQKKLTRPISKLLNPLARSGGYSVAVALNFTQTKMEMPATKQSTISSFFLPQSKKGKDAVDCSSLWPSGMSSTPLSEATKRKREISSELHAELDNKSGTDSRELDTDIYRVSAEVGGDDDDDDKEQQFLHLIWGYQSEQCEPAGKRRPPEIIKTETVSDGQKDSSSAMMHACTNADEPKGIPEHWLRRVESQQYSHENFWLHGSVSGENSEASTAFPSTEDVDSQAMLKDESGTEKDASVLNLRTAITMQNPKKCLVKSYKEHELFERRHQWSPLKIKDKENSRPTSPRHSSALSPFKQRACSSPVKHSSGFNKKLHLTPKKNSWEAQENDEDPFSMLFTQDSEGFRVIAHRSKSSRCPLKDQSNSRECREYFSSPSVKPLEIEENSDPEPEVLFTQDSQGNMVIKH